MNFVRLEKLSNQFYGANLLYGKIDLKPTHTWSFYYVVENTTDKEFIEKEALKTVLLVNEHSREFHFYGKQSQQWENSFDLADITIRPNATHQEIALTMVYSDLEKFIDMLQEEISARYFVPHDTYLIYDNENIYKQILSKLKY